MLLPRICTLTRSRPADAPAADRKPFLKAIAVQHYRVVLTPPERWESALDLVLKRYPLRFRAERKEVLMRRLEGAEPLRLELWHAEDRGAKLRAPQHPIVAAALVEYQPGGVAMGSVPVVAGQRHEPAGVAILRTWLTSLPQRGCRVLQILAEEPLPLHRQILRHAGFPRLTSLLFMAWEAPGPISTLPIPEESPAEDFVIEPFGDQAEMWRRLEHVVEQTYQASLDCPEISGLRSVSDTLTGYRLSAPWKPQLWFLLRQGAQDVGCLLLADRAREETLELVYMGVVPEYRGRGLGRVLIAEAKRQLAALGRKRLVLAVDVRNWPALCAYEKAGFTSFARADVYQRLLVRS